MSNLLLTPYTETVGDISTTYCQLDNSELWGVEELRVDANEKIISRQRKIDQLEVQLKEANELINLSHVNYKCRKTTYGWHDLEHVGYREYLNKYGVSNG